MKGKHEAFEVLLWSSTSASESLSFNRKTSSFTATHQKRSDTPRWLSGLHSPAAGL